MRDYTPLSRKAAVLAAFALILAAVAVSVPVAVFIVERDIADREQAQLEQCERVKLDRIANAVAWTRAAHQWRKDAALPDSSLATKVTASVYEWVSNDFRSRLYQCGPLVREHEQIQDGKAIALVYELARVQP
jgi:hypothetical protein